MLNALVAKEACSVPVKVIGTILGRGSVFGRADTVKVVVAALKVSQVGNAELVIATVCPKSLSINAPGPSTFVYPLAESSNVQSSMVYPLTTGVSVLTQKYTGKLAVPVPSLHQIVIVLRPETKPLTTVVKSPVVSSTVAARPPSLKTEYVQPGVTHVQNPTTLYIAG